MSVLRAKAAAFRSMLLVNATKGALRAATEKVYQAREESAHRTNLAIEANEASAPDLDEVCATAWDAHQALLLKRQERYAKRVDARAALRGFESAVDNLRWEEGSTESD